MFIGGLLIVIALLACIFISTGSFAWGYWNVGYEGIVRWILAFGVLWLAAYWRKWRWIFTPVLLLSILLAVFGVWFEFPPGWILTGAVFALFAWDLAEFQQRLKVVPARNDHPAMIRRRILRISILILAGEVFVSLVMLGRGQFTSDWGFFLAGLVILGSLQAFAWRRR